MTTAVDSAPQLPLPDALQPPPLGEGWGGGLIVERSIPLQGAIELVVHHPPIARTTHVGQFAQIQVNAQHALLRRPYSVAWTDRRERVGFIFNVVGAGSNWLARRREGDSLDLLGPLGRGFNLQGHGPVICVAGGLGVAVFPGVVQALLALGRDVTVLLGARTAAQVLPAKRFAGALVKVATDDGTAGARGSVLELLTFPPPCGDGQGGGVQILTCGPTPMLQALIVSARRKQFPLASIQVALETPMGCGIGTCLGCVAPRKAGGYLLTCQDGPCVRADIIDWERMADAFHG